MDLGILKYEIPGWEDLSNMRNEGLLCYHNNGSLIVVKVHAHGACVNSDDLINSYLRRLHNEVKVMREEEQFWQGYPGMWSIRCLALEEAMAEFAIFAYASIAGVLCSLEIILPNITDLCILKSKFKELTAAIQFEVLEREFGALSLGDGTELQVVGISDICLRAKTEHSLIFVGKDKYFAISIDEDGINNLFEKAMNEFSIDMKEDAEEGARYTIRQRNGLFGSIETNILEFNNQKVNVLGYYLNNLDTDIASNLLFNVQGGGSL